MEDLRRIAASLPDPPPEMEPYLAKVRDRAYTVTDADVEALRTAGLDEDAIFEQTVATAIRAGLARFDAAERVLP